MADSQTPDPRRKTAPYIAAAVGAIVIGVIVVFAGGGAPNRTEKVPVQADPNPSTVNVNGGSKPFEVDAGVKELIDSGTIDPDLAAKAMADAADAGAQAMQPDAN